VPDYVPLAELGIHPNIKAAFIGRPFQTLADDVEFWSTAGYDYIKVQPIIDFNPANISPQEGKRITVEEDGTLERKWATEKVGVITTFEEFERYVFPAVGQADYSRFEQVPSLLPEGMGVVGQHGDIFTMVWEMMGFETFSLCLYENTELVGKMFERIGGLVYSLFENMVSFDCVNALWYSDDVAYAEGLMVSPAVLMKYFFPWLKQIGDLCQRYNKPLIYHSDGVLWDVMDDIISCGVSALHPIEPKAMDIVKVKDRVGGKLCLIGNVDLGNTLVLGTQEKVINEVKEKLSAVAPGGGYCIGSSNSIPNYVNLQNYRAMIETAIEYGKYPITVN
jgi:uroporphyrinogen decarboxylase